MPTTLENAKLIGINGRLGSGKDTIGKMIQAFRPRDLRHYSFARPLKEGIKAMFGWDDEMLEDRTKKEAVDDFWGFSPRKAMQLLGTEYGRKLLRDDIWIQAAQRFHSTSLEINKGTIITDVRFENEAKWIRSQPNSILLHVLNPEDKPLDEKIHESERGVSFYCEDLLVVNDKRLGIDALQESIRSLW